jgi:FkbM family methyltransferase
MDNIVIYTALFTDNIDKIYGIIPEYETNNDIDFVLYTNTPHIKSDVWDVRLVNLEFDDPRKSARQYKLLPHRYLSEYDGWFWIDNSCSFLYNPLDLYNYYLDDGYDISLHRHCDRNCLYDEASTCSDRGLDSSNIISKQIDRYKNDNYPTNNGLYETGILMRKNNKVIRDFNEMWWDELDNFSVRDQISFPYILSKNDVKINAIEETFVTHQSFLNRKQSEHFSSIPRQINYIGDSKMKIKDYNLGEYYIPPNISGTCIDVGANVGSFIVKTFNLFTTFHYYEPFSDNFQRCEEKSSTLDNVTGFKEAVSSTDGDIVELLVPRSGDCGSIAVDSLDIEIRDQNWYEKKFPEKVITVSLETMIERIGGYVNYMKIDCETSEYSLLIGKELSSIGIISMELHAQLGKDRCDELTNYIMKTHTLVRGNSKYIGWASNQHQMLYFENNNLII